MRGIYQWRKQKYRTIKTNKLSDTETRILHNNACFYSACAHNNTIPLNSIL